MAIKSESPTGGFGRKRGKMIPKTCCWSPARLEVSKITGTSLVMIQQHYGHLVSTSASERLAKLRLT
jgi:hypothetical protein